MGLLSPEALQLVNLPLNLDSQACCCRWCFICYRGTTAPQNICALYQFLVMQVLMSQPFRCSVSRSPFQQNIPSKQQATGQILPLVWFWLVCCLGFFNFGQHCALSSLLGLSDLMVNVLNTSCLSQSLVFGAGVNCLIFSLPDGQVPLPPSQALVVSAGLFPPSVDNRWIFQIYQVT